MHPNVSILDVSIGRYMVYSTDDSLNKILLADGVHEPQVLQVSEFILRNSGSRNVLDLGANIGTYSIPLAIKLPEKDIWGYEIQRNVFYQFCGNVFLNSLSNIRPINKGVSSFVGEIEIPVVDYSKCWNIGGFSIDALPLAVDRGDFPNQSMVGRERAEVTTLDEIGNDLGDIGLIKLDVEGHEVDVLAGGIGFLEQNGLPPIIFECWPFEWFREKKVKLFEFFASIGYSTISGDIGYSNFLAQSPRSSHNRFLIEGSTIRVVPRG